MRYQHTFRVAAPIEKVNAFHRSSRSLKAITPPVFFMSHVLAPEELADGNKMAFTMWLGPIPIRWTARVENFSPTGFDDIQTSGPFKSWKHAHRFEALDKYNTQVVDDVEYILQRHWFWGVIGLVMALGLPILFWYRCLRTRAALERNNSDLGA